MPTVPEPLLPDLQPELPVDDSIAIRHVRTLLRAVAGRGRDLDAVLRAAGLDFDPLAPDCPVTFVSRRVYSRLYRELLVQLQDEGFGLNQHRRMPPGTFRMLCRFIIHATDLGQALDRTGEFFDFCDSFTAAARRRRRIVTAGADGLVRCSFDDPNRTPEANDLPADANILYMMHRFFSWLIGETIELERIDLSAPSPARPARYKQLFDAPIRFAAEHNALCFKPGWLNAPLVQNEQTLTEFLRSAPYQLIATERTEPHGSTSRFIRELAARDFGKSFPGADEVARRLGVSARTVHRRLRAEGTSYQALKDNIRRDAALAYIGRPELSNNAVALLLGFQEPSAFHRSFRKWTGYTPGRWRALDEERRLAITAALRDRRG